MQRFLPLLGTLALIASVDAQQVVQNDAVSWTSSAVAVNAPAGERLYRLQFNARIAPGYIVYGSDFSADIGPNPTRVRFTAKDSVTTRETLQSAGTRKGKDEQLKIEYTYFEKQAQLSQLVAVAPDVKSVAGTIRGQTCHEADGTCTLFSAPFEVKLP